MASSQGPCVTKLRLTPGLGILNVELDGLLGAAEALLLTPTRHGRKSQLTNLLSPAWTNECAWRVLLVIRATLNVHPSSQSINRSVLSARYT
jgi:hypothetical protein